MKKPLLALAFAPAMLMAQVQASFLYDVRAKTVIPIATYEVGRFDDVLGQDWFDVEVHAFAGVRAQQRKYPVLTGGFALVMSRKLASNLSVHLGFAGRVEAAESVTPAGIVFGASWKF